jgi:hypothetical protein
MKKPKKPAQRYVRIDGLTAWQLLGYLSRATPKAKVVVCQCPQHGLLALIEADGGPWTVTKGVPELQLEERALPKR